MSLSFCIPSGLWYDFLAVLFGNMFTFIDLFAGIGGLRLAFAQAGARCVFSSEWNKQCQVTYEANFGEQPHGDITKIPERDIPPHDILVAGFPCQPFSRAGVSKNLSLGRKHGFEHETQGALFFDIARILTKKHPHAFLLENVKNLQSHNQGKTYATIQATLNKAGYNIFSTILNAHFYVPQNRERLIIVGFRKDIYPTIVFKFPDPPTMALQGIRDLLEKDVPSNKTLTDGLWYYLQQYAAKHKARGNSFRYGLIDPETDTCTRTLSARYYKDGSEILIKQNGKNPRKLTPRECARLMGFPDTFKIPVSDRQAYKQFGNSVCIPLFTDVAKQVLKAIKEGKHSTAL